MYKALYVYHRGVKRPPDNWAPARLHLLTFASVHHTCVLLTATGVNRLPDYLTPARLHPLTFASEHPTGDRRVPTGNSQAPARQWEVLGQTGQPFHHPAKRPWHGPPDADPGSRGEVARRHRGFQHRAAPERGRDERFPEVAQGQHWEVDPGLPEDLLVSGQLDCLIMTGMMMMMMMMMWKMMMIIFVDNDWDDDDDVKNDDDNLCW